MLASLAAAAGAAFAADRPELGLPIVCEPHKTCFIQSYVDFDPGPGVSDFTCGGASYDAHSGTDFRLLSAAESKPSIAVIASAEGVVKGVRDGVADIFVSKGPPGAVTGRECGNGVVIDHGGGWETQYCHMKQGSVAVKTGQPVKRGDKLGEVGYSGKADFAHVHLTVRHDGKTVDPFLPDAVDGACNGDAKGPGLWTADAAAAFPYVKGEIIAAGFTSAAVAHDALEVDDAVAPLTAAAPTLLLYARFINLRKGDRVRLTISGPGGPFITQESQPLEGNKATYTAIAGRKLKTERWPAGAYQGKVEIVRDGAAFAARDASFEMP